eukprot:365970-Chlamydomonas_euryale.AAC.3
MRGQQRLCVTALTRRLPSGATGTASAGVSCVVGQCRGGGGDFAGRGACLPRRELGCWALLGEGG